MRAAPVRATTGGGAAAWAVAAGGVEPLHLVLSWSPAAARLGVVSADGVSALTAAPAAPTILRLPSPASCRIHWLT